ncbi:MAG: hypothetical protein R2779_07430 [Crocinitomicaceae bacterium]
MLLTVWNNMAPCIPIGQQHYLNVLNYFEVVFSGDNKLENSALLQNQYVPNVLTAYDSSVIALGMSESTTDLIFVCSENSDGCLPPFDSVEEVINVVKQA